MIQQSPTPRNVLGQYQDLLRGAKLGQVVTVPDEYVTLVRRMAHNQFPEKNLRVKADENAAAKEQN